RAQDPDRLPAEQSDEHVDRRILYARAGRRTGKRSADVGRAARINQSAQFHGAHGSAASVKAQRRSLGRLLETPPEIDHATHPGGPAVISNTTRLSDELQFRGTPTPPSEARGRQASRSRRSSSPPRARMPPVRPTIRRTAMLRSAAAT